MNRSLLLVITLCSAAAVAQPGAGAPAHIMEPPPSKQPMKVTLSDAKPLVNALVLSGAKSAKTKTKTTWTFKTLSCATKKAEDEVTGLDTTACQADGKKVTGAAAIVLMQGMQAAKIPQPYRMGGAQIEATDVSCLWETDLHKAGEDGPFVCNYTAAH
jgi:hypothetical protein